MQLFIRECISRPSLSYSLACFPSELPTMFVPHYLSIFPSAISTVTPTRTPTNSLTRAPVSVTPAPMGENNLQFTGLLLPPF